jgi:hypothetical protein
MFCMKCGTNNPDSGAFCTKCGAPLAGQVVTASGAAAGAAVAPAAASAARRVGQQFVVPRAGAPLPPNCVKCGRPTQEIWNKTFWWHNPVLYLIVLISPIIYVIVALIVRKSCKLSVPVCEEHRSSYKSKRWIGGILMLVSIPLWIGIAAAGNGSDNAMAAGVLVFFLAFFVGLIVFAVASIIKPSNMDEQTATFKGAGESFLQMLPS